VDKDNQRLLKYLKRGVVSYKCKEDVRPQKGRQEELFKMIARQEADFYMVGGSRFGGDILPIQP